jgi:hypothetical protein
LVFTLYQEQLKINKGLQDQKKELQDQIFSLSTSHEVLRQYSNLAEQKIFSLEALLSDDSDCSTEFEPEGSTVLDEKIKTQEEMITYLKAENRSMQEALENAGDAIIASSKKIKELEERSAADEKGCTEEL